MSEKVIGICPLCKKERNLLEHHTKYHPEETMLVCESCHQKIHTKPNFYDNLCPEWYVSGEAFRKNKNSRKRRSTKKIKNNRDRVLDLPEDQIVSDYEKGYTWRMLSSKYEVSTTKIRDLLKEKEVLQE